RELSAAGWCWHCGYRTWRGLGFDETVDRHLTYCAIQAGLEIKGEQLSNIRGWIGRGQRHGFNLRPLAPSSNVIRWLSSPQKSETTGVIGRLSTRLSQDHEQRRVTPARIHGIRRRDRRRRTIRPGRCDQAE